MRGMIRATLVIAALAALWSCLWFSEEGVAFLVPGYGGYFFSYEG